MPQWQPQSTTKGKTIHNFTTIQNKSKLTFILLSMPGVFLDARYKCNSIMLTGFSQKKSGSTPGCGGVFSLCGVAGTISTEEKVSWFTACPKVSKWHTTTAIFSHKSPLIPLITSNSFLVVIRYFFYSLTTLPLRTILLQNMGYLSFQCNDAKSEAPPCLPLFVKQDEVLLTHNLLTLRSMKMGFNYKKLWYNLPKYC